jgi:hypothetical protein
MAGTAELLAQFGHRPMARLRSRHKRHALNHGMGLVPGYCH